MGKLNKEPTGAQIAARVRYDLAAIGVRVRRAEDHMKSDKLSEADQELKDAKRKINEMDLWLTLYMDEGGKDDG